MPVEPSRGRILFSLSNCALKNYLRILPLNLDQLAKFEDQYFPITESLKKGDSVTAVVMRDGQEITLNFNAANDLYKQQHDRQAKESSKGQTS